MARQQKSKCDWKVSAMLHNDDVMLILRSLFCYLRSINKMRGPHFFVDRILEQHRFSYLMNLFELHQNHCFTMQALKLIALIAALITNDLCNM